jgi:hypothetical protein
VLWAAEEIKKQKLLSRTFSLDRIQEFLKSEKDLG